MAKTLFQVTGNSGDLIGGSCDSVREAVLTAAQHDGYGVAFVRDDDGTMWLCSSNQHIGNNTYFPNVETDRFHSACSILADNDMAEAEVAEAIRARGVLHSRYALSISELTYNEADQLTHVDGESLELLAAETDSTIEDIRRHYEGN